MYFYSMMLSHSVVLKMAMLSISLCHSSAWYQKTAFLFHYLLAHHSSFLASNVNSDGITIYGTLNTCGV